jgi:hypothetical protein
MAMTVRDLIRLLNDLPLEQHDLPVAVAKQDGEYVTYEMDPDPVVADVLRDWCWPRPQVEGQFIQIFLF